MNQPGSTLPIVNNSLEIVVSQQGGGGMGGSVCGMGGVGGIAQSLQVAVLNAAAQINAALSQGIVSSGGSSSSGGFGGLGELSARATMEKLEKAKQLSKQIVDEKKALQAAALAEAQMGGSSAQVFTRPLFMHTLNSYVSGFHTALSLTVEEFASKPSIIS